MRHLPYALAAHIWPVYISYVLKLLRPQNTSRVGLRHLADYSSEEAEMTTDYLPYEVLYVLCFVVAAAGIAYEIGWMRGFSAGRKDPLRDWRKS